MKYSKHISSPNDPFVTIGSNNQFVGLSSSAFIRLMSCTYLEKHVNLYSHSYPDPVQLWQALQISGHSLSESLSNMLSWLQYDMKKGNVKVISLQEWTDFTRHVCYFDCRGMRDLFQLLLPSDSALRLHALRGEYFFFIKYFLFSV
jgi:hypothetical protein